MNAAANDSTVGVLTSGGLDSCVLIAHLLEQGCRVRPFYIRGGLHWEAAEQSALRRFLDAAASSKLDELVVLDMPLGDLYGDHWSLDGHDAPDGQSEAEAVYLPGRNALLTIKPAIWCSMHGIGRLALATLAGNPFADATDEFFAEFQQALGRAMGRTVELIRPFAHNEKKDVLELGRHMPLERTFSCIVPSDDLHCGRCNKCVERREAFRLAKIEDKTTYKG